MPLPEYLGEHSPILQLYDLATIGLEEGKL